MSDYRDLEFSIENAKPLDIDILDNDMLIEIGVSAGGGKLPTYEGPYEVDPQLYEQTLQTKNRSMTKDVIVNAYEMIQVIDNLDSDSSVDALAARQGKVLKNMIPEGEQIHFDEIDAMFNVVFGN